MSSRKQQRLAYAAERHILMEQRIVDRLVAPDRHAAHAFWGTRGRASAARAARLLGVPSAVVGPRLRREIRAVVPSFDTDVRALLKLWGTQIRAVRRRG